MAKPEASAAPKEHEFLTEMADQIQQTGVLPIDPWHLAAFLEMHGWDDQRAIASGHADLFALSRFAYPRLICSLSNPVLLAAIRPTGTEQWRKALGSFARSILRFVPTLIAAATVILTGKAGLADSLATGKSGAGHALAIWLSILVTGGFQQAITEGGRLLLDEGEISLARRHCVRLLTGGIAASLGLGLLLMSMLEAGPVLLYLTLSLLWLSGSLLRTLNWNLPFLAVTSSAAVLLCLESLLPGSMKKLAPLALYTSPALLLGGIALISLWAALYRLRRLEQTQQALAALQRAPGWREILPHFLCGLLLFTCLLQDRILVWVAGFLTGDLAAGASYELGILLAALAFVIPAGIAEITLEELTAALYRQPAALRAGDYPNWQRLVNRTWLLTHICTSASAILSLWGVQWLIRWLSELSGLNLLPNAVAAAAFSWGLLGYSFLAVGLLNISLLLALNQLKRVILLLATAAIANLAIGCLSAQLALLPALGFPLAAGYPHAAIGFAAGAATLCGLGIWFSKRVLVQTDYFLYLNK